MPAKVGVLDHILGVGAGAEHPIGDPEQPAPLLLESGSAGGHLPY
jgi:hypothetical protein